VIDQLTKVLVGLYEEPEKPQNAVDFIKRSLGAPQESDVDHLKAENEELKRNVTESQKRVDALQRELEAERAKK
jgi:predicted RNase H-like nuclease (RuvC/YqgF family)